MVTAINKDNSAWRLMYNEHILLLDKTNRISFDIYDEVLNFNMTVNFLFLEDGDKYTAKIEIAEDGLSMNISLNKWDSENSMGHVENQEPLKLNTSKGNKIWFKYRTQTNDKANWRNFHLTVWTEIN